MKWDRRLFWPGFGTGLGHLPSLKQNNLWKSCCFGWYACLCVKLVSCFPNILIPRYCRLKMFLLLFTVVCHRSFWGVSELLDIACKMLYACACSTREAQTTESPTVTLPVGFFQFRLCSPLSPFSRSLVCFPFLLFHSVSLKNQDLGLGYPALGSDVSANLQIVCGSFLFIKDGQEQDFLANMLFWLYSFFKNVLKHIIILDIIYWFFWFRIHLKIFCCLVPTL